MKATKRERRTLFAFNVGVFGLFAGGGWYLVSLAADVGSFLDRLYLFAICVVPAVLASLLCIPWLLYRQLPRCPNCSHTYDIRPKSFCPCCGYCVTLHDQFTLWMKQE